MAAPISRKHGTQRRMSLKANICGSAFTQWTASARVLSASLSKSLCRLHVRDFLVFLSFFKYILLFFDSWVVPKSTAKLMEFTFSKTDHMFSIAVPSPIPPPPSHAGGSIQAGAKSNTTLIIIIVVSLVCVIILAGILFYFLYYRKRSQKSLESYINYENLDNGRASFSYKSGVQRL